MTRDEYYDALEHSAFKYIDKWKSKAGNWIYKYADDVSNKAKSSYNVANNITEQDTNFGGKQIHTSTRLCLWMISELRIDLDS